MSYFRRIPKYFSAEVLRSKRAAAPAKREGDEKSEGLIFWTIGRFFARFLECFSGSGRFFIGMAMFFTARPTTRGRNFSQKHLAKRPPSNSASSLSNNRAA